MAYSEKLAIRIRETLLHLSNVEEKAMMGGLTFMVNDKMCIGIIGDEMMCRIDPTLQETTRSKNKKILLINFIARNNKLAVIIEITYMTKQTNEIKIIDVTTDNVSEIGIYCIKDKRLPGFKSKVEWFQSKINKGLQIKIAMNNQNKQLGFIEYISSELAWRPIKADNYLFVQCIALFVKEVKHKRIGTTLLRKCEQDAKLSNKSGVCVMSSDGAWMANKSLFEKNGFVIADKLDRFELMFKKMNNKNPQPKFIDWTKQQAKYKGWNLIYSDQCPWHEKSITDLKQSALDNNIELKVKKLTTPKEAQSAPSGFGTFSLIKDGKLLGDHYLSRTRFENILRQEMKAQ